MPKKFELILGVDQTGAVLGKSQRPKPLPVVLAVKEKKQWRFLIQNQKRRLFLPSFDPDSIEALLKACGFSLSLKHLACIVDCVFGLPLQSGPEIRRGSAYLWDLFYQASDFSLSKKEFGREVAEKFFSQYLPKHSQKIPTRLCEEMSGSNSVFQVRPYQKNIQTGTFRIWKELGGLKKPWASIWPYDSLNKSHSLQDGPWLFEGYPSLLWRKVLQSKSRNPLLLKNLTQKTGLKVAVDHFKMLETAPDHADAFVLALGGIALQAQEELWRPSSHFHQEPRLVQEGWILGLKPRKDI